MDDNRFKSILQDKVNKDKEKAAQDDALRKKYGVEDGRSVGIKIQKESVVIAIWRVISDIIQFISRIIIFGFAFIGIYAILNPSLREILLISLKEVIEQIKVFAPFLPI